MSGFASAIAKGVARFGYESRCHGALLGRAFRAMPGTTRADLVTQLGRVALSALPLVGAAAFFVGMVLALQTSVELARFGATEKTAEAVARAMVREFAPVFTALLMAGKAGAGLASELGMVSLSGQAQAMRALSIDIDTTLIAPRVFACIIGTLLLTIAAMVLGILGGLVLTGASLGASPISYMNHAAAALSPVDIACGLIKAVVFGTIIASMGCTFGLRETRDAGDLGRNVMGAVVLASFCVLIGDHLITSAIVAVWG